MIGESNENVNRTRSRCFLIFAAFGGVRGRRKIRVRESERGDVLRPRRACWGQGKGAWRASWPRGGGRKRRVAHRERTRKLHARVVGVRKHGPDWLVFPSLRQELTQFLELLLPM